MNCEFDSKKKLYYYRAEELTRQVKGQYDYEGENTEKHNFLVQINMKLEKLIEWLKADLLISKCLRYNRNYQKRFDKDLKKQFPRIYEFGKVDIKKFFCCC